MINGKQQEIIQYLYDGDGFLTADYLAKMLDISSRTIKRYIDVINDELKEQHIEIISVRGSGYQLKGPTKEIELLIHKNFSEEENQQRTRQIILWLLEASAITIDELAIKLHYSSSTINKLTPAIKQTLAKYGLELLSRPYYGLSIEGGELNKRALLIDYGFYVAYGKLHTNLINISTEEFEKITTILLDYLKENEIVVADRDIHNLLEKITISISRSKKGCHILKLPIQEDIRHHNYDVVFEILARIGKELAISIHENEYNYVSIYSGFMVYSFHPKVLNSKTELQEFVMEVLQEISLLSGVDYTQQEIIVNYLATHLNMLLTRFNQDVRLKNPMLKQIKSEYVMEMNYAIFLAKKMEERYHIKITEDELGYLAMYFGTAGRQTQKKRRAAILCHYGIGTAQLIGEQIKDAFPELEIVGIYPIHYLDLAKRQMIDFIISTVAIEDFDNDKPVIIIDNLLSDKSLSYIKTAMESAGQNQENLYCFFNEGAYFTLSSEDKNSAIEELADQLISAGYIDEGIKMNVLERENISGTAIGNLIAIPHTIFNSDFKSIIGVGILKKTIPWDLERVQLIFMLCFNNNDKESAAIFRQLYKIIKNPTAVNQLINSNDYQEFITYLKGDNK